MAGQLDHLIVPSKSRDAAARQLAEILGVEYGRANIGPFTAVYVSDSLTIDFDEWHTEFPKGHYCFKVSDLEFETILGRIRMAGIPYRSTPLGPDDGEINTSLTGKIVYWGQPDGHAWELLTASYARREGE